MLLIIGKAEPLTVSLISFVFVAYVLVATSQLLDLCGFNLLLAKEKIAHEADDITVGRGVIAALEPLFTRVSDTWPAARWEAHVGLRLAE